jgi:GT2 family glycosyltransferase
MPPAPAQSKEWTSREVAVVIPTYRRGTALLETLRQLLALASPPGEMVVVDQTETHPPEVEQALRQLDAGGRIRWLRQTSPSIPRAMNAGLRAATRPVVLFLDDDIEPAPELVAAHAARHDGSVAAVCGQVLQPGESPDAEANRGPRRTGFRADLDFRFNGTAPAEIANIMAGNLSVLREAALAIGGFDEQFIGSAYRFETDFARRLRAAGRRILFAPEASLRHLRLPSGGTRSDGGHLERPSPRHAAGDYYFALRHARGAARWGCILGRPFRETCNRYHLRHPWRIPARLLAELGGLALALRLHRQGPRYMSGGAV